MKIKITFICFILLLFLNSCKCDYYFSNNGKNKKIEELLFNIECHVIKNVMTGKEDKLNIAIDYHEHSSKRIDKKSVVIYPISSDSNDTLNLISEYASNYLYEIKPPLKKKLNIIMIYVEDSSGIKHSKVIRFYELSKIKLCRTRTVLH